MPKCANIYIVNRKCGCGGTGRRAGLRNQCQRRGGSSPFIRTNDVSVRTFYRTERYKYHSEKDGIFLLQIAIPKGKDGAKNEDN